MGFWFGFKGIKKKLLDALENLLLKVLDALYLFSMLN